MSNDNLDRNYHMSPNYFRDQGYPHVAGVCPYCGKEVISNSSLRHGGLKDPPVFFFDSIRRVAHVSCRRQGLVEERREKRAEELHVAQLRALGVDPDAKAKAEAAALRELQEWLDDQAAEDAKRERQARAEEALNKRFFSEKEAFAGRV